MPTEPPPQPRDLSVERDLGGLRYRVTTWERALPRLLGTYFVLLGAEIGAILLSAAALSLLSPELFEIVLMFAQLFTSVIFMAPMLLAIWRVYQQVAVDVRIDHNGMLLARKAGSEQVTWAACEDVRRDGRLVEVMIGGRWQVLPSPNAYTDAAWLEGLIRDKIDARRGDAIAPPEEIAAALRALGAQSRERSR